MNKTIEKNQRNSFFLDESWGLRSVRCDGEDYPGRPLLDSGSDIPLLIHQ